MPDSEASYLSAFELLQALMQTSYLSAFDLLQALMQTFLIFLPDRSETPSSILICVD